MMSLKSWGRNKPGGKRYKVQNQVAYLLNRLADTEPAVFALLWNTITQGKGDAPASRGTHAEGYCVDFSFKARPWNREVALRVYRALKPFFGVAFREAGEAGPSAHLHIALKGHANAQEILNANQGDRRVIDRVNAIFPD